LARSLAPMLAAIYRPTRVAKDNKTMSMSITLSVKNPDQSKIQQFVEVGVSSCFPEG
jgi:hypothetical protein